MPLPYDTTLRGIRGSLSIFLIACGVVAAIAMIDVVGMLEAFAYFQRKLGMPLPLGDRLIGLATSGSKVIVPLMVIAAMLRIRRPFIPRAVIAALWLVFVLEPGFHAIETFASPLDRHLPGIWAFQAWRLGLGLAFCIGATIYLLTSRRVALTFAASPLTMACSTSFRAPDLLQRCDPRGTA